MSDVNKSDLFWRLADPMLASGEVEKGTMMGFPCLRVSGKFFASLEHTSDALIVKLPKARVTELVEMGKAEPFAPNGRVFKEWALIRHADEASWKGFLDEAQMFVLEAG